MSLEKAAAPALKLATEARFDSGDAFHHPWKAVEDDGFGMG